MAITKLDSIHFPPLNLNPWNSYQLACDSHLVSIDHIQLVSTHSLLSTMPHTASPTLSQGNDTAANLQESLRVAMTVGVGQHVLLHCWLWFCCGNTGRNVHGTQASVCAPKGKVTLSVLKSTSCLSTIFITVNFLGWMTLNGLNDHCLAPCAICASSREHTMDTQVQDTQST